MSEFKKTYHHISIYLFNDILYVVPSVEIPPIFVWTLVNPVEKIENFSQEKLESAIDSSKTASKSHFDPAHSDPQIKQWDGEKNQVWNKATKLWSVWWNEDGSVDMDLLAPYKMFRGSMEWKKIPEVKKSFAPQASFQDIARKILSQI